MDAADLVHYAYPHISPLDIEKDNNTDNNKDKDKSDKRANSYFDSDSNIYSNLVQGFKPMQVRDVMMFSELWVCVCVCIYSIFLYYTSGGVFFHVSCFLFLVSCGVVH